MKKLLNLLLLGLATMVASVVATQAQNIPGQLDWPGFIGNPVPKTILLDRADSAQVVTVLAYADANTTQRLPASQQPAVSRSGRAVIVQWSGAQTLAMNAQNWVQVSWGGSVKFYGTLTLSKKTLATNPGSLTVVNYVAPMPTGFAQGNLTKFYNLANTQPGHVFTHAGASRLVTGGCFDEMTGLADPLWRVEPVDDNTAILRGPPGETFSGTVVLTVFQRLTN